MSAPICAGVPRPGRAVAAARGLPPARRRATTKCRAPAGRPRPHCEPLVRSLEGARPPRARVALGERQARDPRQRRHLQRLRRSAGRRSAVDARHDAAAHLAGGMEPHRRRAAAAHAAAQPDPRRPLRPAAAAPRRPAAAVAGAREPGVPAAVSRHPRAARRVPAPARRRSRALARRPVVGARRPHAGAVRRRLRAGEPHRAVAQPAGGVSRLPGAAARRVLPRATATR